MLTKKMIAVIATIAVAGGSLSTATAVIIRNNPSAQKVSSATTSTEVQSVAVSKADIDAIAEATSSALQSIESARVAAVSDVQAASKTATAVSKKSATETATAASSETVSKPTNIAIDVKSETSGVSLWFRWVNVLYDHPLLTITYSETNDDFHAVNFIATDKDGNPLHCSYPLGSSTTDRGALAISGATSVSQLSTIHIIYTVDGGDPVTVTINIPGL